MTTSEININKVDYLISLMSSEEKLEVKKLGEDRPKDIQIQQN